MKKKCWGVKRGKFVTMLEHQLHFCGVNSYHSTLLASEQIQRIKRLKTEVTFTPNLVEPFLKSRVCPKEASFVMQTSEQSSSVFLSARPPTVPSLAFP